VHHRAARSSRHERDRGDDTPLTGKEIQAVFVRHQSSIARCLRDIDRKDAPKEVAAHVAIETDGSVGEVTFEPPLTGSAGACLSKALSALHFRKHPIEGLKVTVPLKLQVL
jgi:hypothetical protein